METVDFESNSNKTNGIEEEERRGDDNISQFTIK